MLNPTLYTPTPLPMIPRPGTQAVLYLVPTKYLFQSSSPAHSTEITLEKAFTDRISAGHI